MFAIQKIRMWLTEQFLLNWSHLSVFWSDAGFSLSKNNKHFVQEKKCILIETSSNPTTKVAMHIIFAHSTLFFFHLSNSLNGRRGGNIERKSSKGKVTSTKMFKKKKKLKRVQKCECKLHFINSAEGYLLGFTWKRRFLFLEFLDAFYIYQNKHIL